MALLSCRRKIASDSAEASCAIVGPETAADLLYQFDHPDVPFRTIIVERHTKVCHEAKYIVSLLLQAINYGSWSRPRLSLPDWRSGSETLFRRPRVQRIRLLYDLFITTEQRVFSGGGNLIFTCCL
jgi:hypothetical protein